MCFLCNDEADDDAFFFFDSALAKRFAASTALAPAEAFFLDVDAVEDASEAEALFDLSQEVSLEALRRGTWILVVLFLLFAFACPIFSFGFADASSSSSTERSFSMEIVTFSTSAGVVFGSEVLADLFAVSSAPPMISETLVTFFRIYFVENRACPLLGFGRIEIAALVREKIVFVRAQKEK